MGTRPMAATLLAAAAALWGTCPMSAHAAQPAAGKQESLALEKTVVKVLKIGYLLYLPEEYGKPEAQGKKWPLLVFLHGSGESGSDLEKVKAHGPPKLIAGGKAFPFIVVSPQAPTTPRRGWDVETLNALLDEIIAHYAVDEDRVYLSGLSMGGYGAWAWATANPERFAAVAPICGGGQPRMAARRMRDLPVWAFHGAKDPTVPVQESEDMIAALTKAGAAEAKLTIYPEAGHDSWTVTYDNPELYAWLLRHERKKPAAGDAGPR
jgi:predicted peptidase